MSTVALVLGGRGAGKTTLLQALVAREVARGERLVVVADQLGHWGRERPGILPLCLDAESAAREAIRRAPSLLVVDEVDLALPAYRPIAAESALYEILHVGRQARAHGPWARRGPVGFLAAARRPANVRLDFRALLSTLYCGRLTDPGDLAWVASLGVGLACGRARCRCPGATRGGRACLAAQLERGEFHRRDL